MTAATTYRGYVQSKGILCFKEMLGILWISNHMPSKVWDEITNPSLNFNDATAEVKEWTSNLIPHFIMDIITYPC